MSDDRPVIAVIGATGAQGGAVVRALTDRGAFRVRAITRNPSTYTGPADEVRAADLADPSSLEAAFAGAHGVFAMSNFTSEGLDEYTQGRHAVEAATSAGVRHFIWSTQPNVEQISSGQFEVPHFTDKARVDDVVRGAGFESFTFVIPPFYFENFVSFLAPQPLPDGSTGWALPIPSSARVVHAASIEDLGGVVAGAFDHPDTTGAGAYLSSAAELVSFEDFAITLRAQGHSISIVEVPSAIYATFYPGADEMAQMMGYWVSHTYLGPNADEQIAAARRVSTTPSTDFDTWAAGHMASTGS
ncbi:MAG: NAD(P)H-binding protein [Actinobacteria bacterium]|uniref:Unannotated protein n=1 Tax=freshwater metagenome TaxID=449393 RepID=A0A6J7SJZ4_9ZZZZ|nr:NAD(P)H-binding protein [Actinomycetota bacterium]